MRSFYLDFSHVTRTYTERGRLWVAGNEGCVGECWEGVCWGRKREREGEREKEREREKGRFVCPINHADLFTERISGLAVFACGASRSIAIVANYWICCISRPSGLGWVSWRASATSPILPPRIGQFSPFQRERDIDPRNVTWMFAKFSLSLAKDPLGKLMEYFGRAGNWSLRDLVISFWRKTNFDIEFGILSIVWN